MSNTSLFHPEAPHNSTDPHRLLTAIEVADLLRVGVKKVYGLPITQVRLSDSRIRYCLSDVQAFVMKSRRTA
jgi:hypothetical protein